MTGLKATPLLVALLALLSVIILGETIGSAYRYKFKSDEIITVTGSAAQDFTSDLIVWQGNYGRKSTNLKEAFEQLKDDQQKIKEYLVKQGIKDNEMVFGSADITREYEDQRNKDGEKIGSTFTGFAIKQTVKIESKDIDKVEKISREITELIEDGIELYSPEPRYYFSKLADLKITLLEKASADCRLRAETIAKQSKTNLGKLRRSMMGVFQITGQNSDEEYSSGGTYNTTSKYKTATISIRMDFATD